MRYCSIVATAPQFNIQANLSFTFDPDPGIQVFLVSARGVEERNPYDASDYWGGIFDFGEELKGATLTIDNLNAEIRTLTSALSTYTVDFKNISIA
jgi:hypothetical protein